MDYTSISCMALIFPPASSSAALRAQKRENEAGEILSPVAIRPALFYVFRGRYVICGEGSLEQEGDAPIWRPGKPFPALEQWLLLTPLLVCGRAHSCGQRGGRHERRASGREQVVVVVVVVSPAALASRVSRARNSTHLKLSPLKLNCVSMMPVVLTLVLSTSCCVGV